MNRTGRSTILSLAAITLVIGGTGATGCSKGCPVIRLNVHGADQAATLRATVTSGGLTGTATLTQGSGGLGQVALDVPEGVASGPITVALDALDAQGCLIASGPTSINTGGQCLPDPQDVTLTDGHMRFVDLSFSQGVPAGVVKLRVATAVAGQAPAAAQDHAAGAASPIELRVPDSGDVLVYVEGLSADGCVAARGQASVAAGGACPARADVALTAFLDSPLCDCSADGWCREYPAARNDALFDVFSLDGQDVWAVGAQGLILHSTQGGAAGTFQAVDSGTRNDLHGIFGTQKLGLWAVGKAGTILQYDAAGGAWRSMPIDAGFRPTGVDWYAIFGLDDTLWIAGGDEQELGKGAVMRYTQGQGLVMSASLPADGVFGNYMPIYGVWASGKNDVWATGGQYARGGMGDIDNRPWKSLLLHWDGSAWKDLSAASTIPLRRIWGSAPNDVWFVGGCSPVARDTTCVKPNLGVVLHYSGAGAPSKVASTAAPLSWVGGGTGGVLVAGGDPAAQPVQQGLIMRCTLAGCNGVSGANGGAMVRSGWLSASGDLLTVGEYASLLRVPAGSSMVGGPPEGPVPGRDVISAVWARGPDEAWAVGENGAGSGVVYHFDGTRWIALSPAPAIPRSLNGVASDGQEVWFAADQGHLVRVMGVSGGTVNVQDTTVAGVSSNLVAIWGRQGDLWAVGDGATILRRQQGGPWSVQTPPPGGLRFDAITGNDSGDLWLAGGQTSGNYQAVLYHANWQNSPVAWQAITLDDPQDWLVGMWSTGPGQVLGGGDAHDHNYGTVPVLAMGQVVKDQLQGQKVQPGDIMSGVWASAPHDVWAVGGNFAANRLLAGIGAAFLYHSGGDAWSGPLQARTDYSLSALTGSGFGNVWAVGPGATIVRRRLLPPSP